MHDKNGLEVIDPEHCLQLLESVPVGRIAYSARALPAVQPVTVVGARGVQIVSDPGQVRRLRQLPLRSWFGAPEEDKFIRISIEMIDGRHITAGAAAPD